MICPLNIEKRQDRAPQTGCSNEEEFTRKNALKNSRWSGAQSLLPSNDRVAKKIYEKNKNKKDTTLGIPKSSLTFVTIEHGVA